jgi:hypothetical protein
MVKPGRKARSRDPTRRDVRGKLLATSNGEDRREKLQEISSTISDEERHLLSLTLFEWLDDRAKKMQGG